MFYIRCVLGVPSLPIKTHWHLGTKKDGTYKMFNTPNAKGVFKFDSIDSAIDCVNENKDFILRCGNIVSKVQIIFKEDKIPMKIMKEYGIIESILIKKGI